MPAAASRLAAASLAGLTAVLVSAGPGTSAEATTAPATMRTVTMVFEPKGIALSPRAVGSREGSTLIVVFKIRNSTPVGRRLVIGGYRSPLVPAGSKRNYSVGFTTTGSVSCRSVPAKGRVFSRSLKITAG
jgi:hypothetical protein